MKEKNILLVWDRMGDYHRARWKALQEATTEAKVYAADLGGNDHLYHWNNTEQSDLYFQLSSEPPEKIDVRRVLNFIRIVRSNRIGCIAVAGYGRIEYLFFIVYGKLTGRRVIVFAESWYPSAWIKDKLKSKFINFFCDGFLVSGSRAFNHFTKVLNVNSDRIKVGYSVVDNDHFYSNNDLQRPNLLCVARFSEEKNLALLISAFKKSFLPQHGWTLTIIGGGPLQNQLTTIADEAIKLLDWQPYEKLPKVYAQARVFILPSIFEPWGLVVNEAMAAGLPIILSDEVGCLPDLLDSSNGWSFKAADENDLVSVLNEVCHRPADECIKMGMMSQEKIKDFSLNAFSMHLKELIIDI